MKKFLIASFAVIFAAAPLIAVTESKTTARKKTGIADKASPSPSPTPGKKRVATAPKSAEKPTPSPTPRKKRISSTPPPEEEAAPTPQKKKKPAVGPSPTPEEEAAETPVPKKKTTPTPTPEPSASPDAKRTTRGAAPNATLSTAQLAEFSKQPAKIQRLLETGLALTEQDLTYTYGSADPANGGMDCSGFVYYVLGEQGLKDIPRSASEQYKWVRKAGKFFAVLSRKNGTFELDDLRPGDLLFWTGTYATQNDPPISHAMIYLGKEKRTGKRVMVGSSDGRTYDGQSRWGVSVFDFAVETRDSSNGPRFVGYAKIPGLDADE